MEVGQLADQAVRTLTTRLSSVPPGTDAGVLGAGRDADPSAVAGQAGSGDPLNTCFTLLAGADSWGKLALQRVCRDPRDGRAVADLTHSLEQAARLHPRLAAELELVIGNRETRTAVHAG